MPEQHVGGAGYSWFTIKKIKKEEVPMIDAKNQTDTKKYFLKIVS